MIYIKNNVSSVKFTSFILRSSRLFQMTKSIWNPSKISSKAKGSMIKVRDLGELFDSITHLFKKPLYIFHVSLSVFLSNVYVNGKILRYFAKIDQWNCCRTISLNILLITSVIILSEVIEDSILTEMKGLFERGTTVKLLVAEVICSWKVILSPSMEYLGELRTNLRVCTTEC